MHTHTFTTAEPGLDICTGCDATQHNPHTAPDHVLQECACGRGWARFLDGDRTPDGPVCASCLAEIVAEQRREGAAA